MNGFWSRCHCFPHTHPRTVYPATFRVVLQSFPFLWGWALTLPLYLCAPPCRWLLRWAACAVCLISCQINAGVLWSHLKKELLHVKRWDGAQLDLTDGWIIHCKQLSCEVRIFWLKIVWKQIVVTVAARYSHVLMQACMNSGTLVQFAFQLLVKHYFSPRSNDWTIWKSKAINKWW